VRPPEADIRPIHFPRDTRDIAARDIRDIRYTGDKCWHFAASHHTFVAQGVDPPALSPRVSVLNPPQEAAGR
jgi:hypothetical protein